MLAMIELSSVKNDRLEVQGVSRGSKGGFFGEIIKFTIIAVIIVVPFRMFIAQPFIVSGASMDPTFENGEYLIVDQLSYRFEEPRRGSVLIFRYPRKPSTFFIKRIIGLPSERIEIERGVVTIKNAAHPDGFTLADEYVTSENRKIEDLNITLDDDEYFVMGDNRGGSLDSRAWGPVKEELIIGRPILRVLPFSKAEVFPGNFIIKE